MTRSKRTGWLVLGLAALVVMFAPSPFASPAPVEHTLRVEASSFAYSPGVLHINPGDIVTIELISTDVVHGLYLDGYDLAVTADPGQTAHLTFTADRPGSFRFRCNVTCGALHPFMIGRLQVGPNLLLWRSAGLVALAAVSSIFLFRRQGHGEAI